MDTWTTTAIHSARLVTAASSSPRATALAQALSAPTTDLLYRNNPKSMVRSYKHSKVVFPSPKSDSCVCIIKDGSGGDSAAKEKLSSSSAESAIVVEMSASGSVASPPVVEKKSSGQVRLPINAGPKCPVCQKTVYKMEELNAVGRIWHTNCFTCGGGKADTEGIIYHLKLECIRFIFFSLQRTLYNTYTVCYSNLH